jgi:vitamin B12 transporter
MFSLHFGPRALSLLCCTAALSLPSLPSSAQTDAATTPAAAPRIVITAARVEQPLPDALPSTRVITRAEIDTAQAADLPSLLRALTSIDVAQTGPLGSQASLFLRGADSRQTLVLVDGVPLLRADFGTASWQHLPLDQIERIEIVRGNLSALYGAQAVGGVVQIVTRRARVPQASLAVGSQGAQQAAFAGGARLGDTQLSASLSWQRSDGYSARDAAADPGANPDRDGSRQVGASARLEQRWSEGHVGELSLLAGRTRSEYDGFTPGLHDVLTTRVQAAGFKSRHALSAMTTAELAFGQTEERFEDPTGLATSGRNRVRLLGMQIGHALNPQHDLQFGLETRRERFGDSNTDTRTRTTDSVRVAWLGRPAVGWQIQAALRSDDSSDFGRATTGLLAVAWHWSAAVKLSAQWASGFSAPTFLDQSFANPATALRPERSRQGEVALQWADGAALLRAALFAQRQRDRISFDPLTFETVNIARAKNRGFELMAQYPLPFDADGVLGADITLQDPRDATTDQPLKRRARQSIALNYRMRIAAWQLGAAWRHTGRRLDTDPVTFADAFNPARSTLDVSASRALTPHWRVAAKIDNLLRERRPEVLGYTAPPRALLVSVQGTLR